MADDPRLTAIRARLEHYKYELLPAPYDGVRQDYREHVQDLLDLVASHARAVEGLTVDRNQWMEVCRQAEDQADALRAALSAKDQQLQTLLDYGEGMKANLAAKDQQIAHLHGLYDDVGQQRTDAIAALIQARQQLAALRQQLEAKA